MEENQPVVCGTQPSSPNNKTTTVKFPPPATKATRTRVIKTPATTTRRPRCLQTDNDLTTATNQRQGQSRTKEQTGSGIQD